MNWKKLSKPIIFGLIANFLFFGFVGQANAWYYPSAYGGRGYGNRSNQFQTFTSRFRWIATSAASTVALEFGNYYTVTPNPQEHANTNSITIKVALEKADGSSFTPVTFNNGSATATLNGGDRIISDKISFPISSGTSFYVRTYLDTGGAGNFYPVIGQLSPPGYGGTDSYTASADLAYGTGQIGLGVPIQTYSPIAIFGVSNTVKPWVAIVGDSTVNSADNNNDRTSLISTPPTKTTSPSSGGGFLTRALLSSGIGSIGVSVGGEQALNFAGSNITYRLPIIQGASYWVIDYGLNDTPFDTATLEARLTAIANLAIANGALPIGVTLLPKSISTDLWSTAANQTPDGHWATKIAVNNWLRGVPGPFVGVLDVADAVESLRDSGVWKDGQILDSGAVSAADSLHLSATAPGWVATNFANERTTVFISGGTGIGQTRRVTNNTATRLTITPSWTTIPDTTSTYVIRQTLVDSDGTHPSPYGHYLEGEAIRTPLVNLIASGGPITEAFSGDTISTAKTTCTGTLLYGVKIMPGLAVAPNINNVTTNGCPTGIVASENAVMKNIISYVSNIADISIGAGKSVTGTSNLFGNSASSGAGTYTEGGGTLFSANPHLVSASDYHLLYNSQAIDAGTAVAGVTTDYAGNPIYGTPDIGAYEYQPPHNLTIATPDTIDIGAGARIYADGKFRDLGTTNSTPAHLKVIPSGGSFASYDAVTTRPAWLDITNITNWTNTHKTWTESNAQDANMVTDHTIGDLEANKYYNVKVDNVLGTNITGANCTSGACLANENGVITFTYSGGYSTHTFDIDSIPTIATIPSPTSSPVISPVEKIIQTIRYYANAPYVYFSAPSAHAFDLPFTFDASESFSAKGIAKYGWDFGDGTTAEGMKIDHQYQSPGRYTVTLTVTDKAGKTATKQQTVDANPSKPTVEDISADGNDLVFKGKSYPKTIVHLDIHSNPLAVQTNTDDKGEWVYKINNAKEILGEGDHTVLASASYVLADQTELKSEPSKTYDFKVSLDGDKLKVEMGKTRTWQYVSLVSGLIIILLVTFLVLRRKKRF